ncbi:hypothetical protein BLNAU_14914 [Blattamonas nauphoetae]|uniref:Uncharacterized protein n=1 Tax=Blattamonas nauphoetae TaxID=2049346 RepID=A0ABQ9XHJ6_9EUKA|nr:hypothetical protein BLNAU_14914 [Blattamonas nauphoetae]
MEILDTLTFWCSFKVRYLLVKADLVPQLNMTLNPQSLSFAEAVNIHTNLLSSITYSLWLTTPDCLEELEIKDADGQLTVHKTVFQQVLTPSEKYICHLCLNRYSITDVKLSDMFMILLTRLLRICPYYQPTMEFVLHMPLFLSIPSCLTFFESERSIWNFLSLIVGIQREWNKTGGVLRQMWKKVVRILRMEGCEDAMEAKLQNDKNTFIGGSIVARSIEWNNLQGMNLPE